MVCLSLRCFLFIDDRTGPKSMSVLTLPALTLRLEHALETARCPASKNAAVDECRQAFGDITTVCAMDA